MKKIIRYVFCVLVMGWILLALSSFASAAESMPDGKIVSVCYSPELDLYAAVGVSGENQSMIVTYTSGDGKTWVRSGFLIVNPSGKFGTIAANSYNINPQAVLWNPQEHKFILCVIGSFYESSDGFIWQKLGDACYFNDTAINAPVYSLYWDGAQYWATTTRVGEVVQSLGDDLLQWSSHLIEGAGEYPFTSIVGTPHGRVYATTAQSDCGLWSMDKEGTWSLLLKSNEGPQKTLGGVYVPDLDRIILMGLYGNGMDITSRSAGAVGIFNPNENAATDGLKQKLAKLGTLPISPGPPGTMVCNEDGTELTVFFLDGKSFGVSFKEERMKPDLSQRFKPEKWVQLQANTQADNMGQMSWLGSVYGNGGYVAVGGNPAHQTTVGQEPIGGALFLPEGFGRGYQKAAFLEKGYISEGTSLQLTGPDEIAIQGEAVRQRFEIRLRDQKGAVLKQSLPELVWSLEGNPKGIKMKDGVLSVLPDASPGAVVIRAQTTDGKLFGRKKVRLTFSAIPSSIEITEGNRTAVVGNGLDLELQYTAVVYDQRGGVMQDEAVCWSIADTAGTALSINQNGQVILPAGITAGSFKVAAHCAAIPALKAICNVEIIRAAPELYITELSKVETVKTGNPAVTVSAKLVNTAGQDQTAILILAVYDQDQRLTGIKTGQETVIPPTGQEIQISEVLELPVSLESSGQSARVYVWTSLSEGKPVRKIK